MYVRVCLTTNKVQAIAKKPIPELPNTVVLNKPELSTTRPDFLKVVKDEMGNFDVIEINSEEKQVIIQNNVRRLRAKKIKLVKQIRKQKEMGTLSLIIGNKTFEFNNFLEELLRVMSFLLIGFMENFSSKQMFVVKVRSYDTNNEYDKVSYLQLQKIFKIYADYVNKLVQAELIHIQNLNNISDDDENTMKSYNVYSGWPSHIYQYNSWDEI